MSGISISGANWYPMQNGTSYKSCDSSTPAETVQTSDENVIPPFTSKADETKSLIEQMREAREKAEKQREKFKLPKNTRYGDASIEAYSRLARARNTAEVNSASGYARRRITQLKAAKASDKENARRIQAVINQLQKAVMRAGKKKNDLEKERLSEIRREKLEDKNQKSKAQRLHQQLKSRKISRMIRESAYITEADIDNKQQDQIAKTERELREQMQTLSQSMSGHTDGIIRQYTSTIPAETSMPAPEICVQA